MYDFNAYQDNQIIFNGKTINNEASYNFGILGKLVDYDYNYNKTVTTQKPQGFVYYISLLGKAYGKAESVQKAFEKKLNGFTLIKKGYVGNAYSCVYKNNKNIVVITNNGTSNPLFYILKNDFDISSFINKIVEKSDDSTSSYDEMAVDTTAVAVDTAAVVVDTVAYYD